MRTTTHNFARLLVSFGLAAGMSAASHAATVNVYLRVDPVTVPGAVGLPGPFGNVAPVAMWQFVQTDATLLVPGPVYTAWAPGPPISANAGDFLNIQVLNGLPPASPTSYTEPVSVIIPGQPGAMAPVWIDGTTGDMQSEGSRISGDVTSRVRSFTNETVQGDIVTYTFGPLKAGTYLYQSGTHPAVQLQMGLYGVLKVLPAAAGRAYADASSAFDAEATLLFSEVDPVLHAAVAAGQYGPGTALTSTVDYHPSYFLVNGLPYPSTGLIPGGSAGQRLLLRFLNGGLQTKVPTVLGPHMSVIAEDGNFMTATNTAGTVVPASKLQYDVFLPAGKTMDAILTPTAEGTIPVFDRRGNLANGGVSPGGMLAYLSVGGSVGTNLGIDPALLSFSTPRGIPSAPKSVTITNSGGGSASVTGAVIATGTASMFSVTTSPLPVALGPGASTTMQVTFSPTRTTSLIAKISQLQVTTTDPAHALLTADLTGNLTVPLLAASPSPFAISTARGTSAEALLTITNTGAVAGLVDSYAIAGGTATNRAMYSITGTIPPLPAILAPSGGSMTLTVRFSPPAATSPGSKNVTLNLFTNNNPTTLMVALQGTATVPTFSLLPSPIAFSTARGTPQSTDVTLTNTSTATGLVNSTVITGGTAINRAMYSVTGIRDSVTNAPVGPLPVAVAPGAGLIFTIQFSPPVSTSIGGKNVNFGINTNANPTRVNDALQGTATGP